MLGTRGAIGAKEIQINAGDEPRAQDIRERRVGSGMPPAETTTQPQGLHTTRVAKALCAAPAARERPRRPPSRRGGPPSAGRQRCGRAPPHTPPGRRRPPPPPCCRPAGRLAPTAGDAFPGQPASTYQWQEMRSGPRLNIPAWGCVVLCGRVGVQVPRHKNTKTTKHLSEQRRLTSIDRRTASIVSSSTACMHTAC